MKLNLQVTRLQDGAKVPVHVVAAGKLDFQQTASMGWQTNWKTMDTAYFPNRVALKTEEQELLGLMSYFCDDRFLAVELVYLESQPESNANLLHQNGKERSIRELQRHYLHMQYRNLSIMAMMAWYCSKQKRILFWNTIFTNLEHVR